MKKLLRTLGHFLLLGLCSWWGVVEGLYGVPREGGPCQADTGKPTPKPLPPALDPWPRATSPLLSTAHKERRVGCVEVSHVCWPGTKIRVCRNLPLTKFFYRHQNFPSTSFPLTKKFSPHAVFPSPYFPLTKFCGCQRPCDPSFEPQDGSTGRVLATTEVSRLGPWVRKEVVRVPIWYVEPVHPKAHYRYHYTPSPFILSCPRKSSSPLQHTAPPLPPLSERRKGTETIALMF